MNLQCSVKCFTFPSAPGIPRSPGGPDFPGGPGFPIDPLGP